MVIFQPSFAQMLLNLGQYYISIQQPQMKKYCKCIVHWIHPVYQMPPSLAWAIPDSLRAQGMLSTDCLTQSLFYNQMFNISGNLWILCRNWKEPAFPLRPMAHSGMDAVASPWRQKLSVKVSWLSSLCLWIDTHSCSHSQTDNLIHTHLSPLDSQRLFLKAFFSSTS